MIGKGLHFAPSHPYVVGPMVIVTTVWGFFALNISLSDFVSGGMQSAWSWICHIANWIDDYFEGIPVVRLVLGLFILYDGFLLLGAIGFCV